MERRVLVWDKPYTVQVERKSKSVWIASGEYMGDFHAVEDRSDNAAVLGWLQWARYKGNG